MKLRFSIAVATTVLLGLSGTAWGKCKLVPLPKEVRFSTISSAELNLAHQPYTDTKEIPFSWSGCTIQPSQWHLQDIHSGSSQNLIKTNDRGQFCSSFANSAPAGLLVKQNNEENGINASYTLCIQVDKPENNNAISGSGKITLTLNIAPSAFNEETTLAGDMKISFLADQENQQLTLQPKIKIIPASCRPTFSPNDVLFKKIRVIELNDSAGKSLRTHNTSLSLTCTGGLAQFGLSFQDDKKASADNKGHTVKRIDHNTKAGHYELLTQMDKTVLKSMHGIWGPWEKHCASNSTCFFTPQNANNDNNTMFAFAQNGDKPERMASITIPITVKLFLEPSAFQGIQNDVEFEGSTTVKLHYY